MIHSIQFRSGENVLRKLDFTIAIRPRIIIQYNRKMGKYTLLNLYVFYPVSKSVTEKKMFRESYAEKSGKAFELRNLETERERERKRGTRKRGREKQKDLKIEE